MAIKEITIEVPKGYEIDRNNSTLEHIIFKELPKKPERITKWAQFDNMPGYFVDTMSEIKYNNGNSIPINDKNVWPTKELAEASLALCQLIRYRDNWRDSEDAHNSEYRHSIIRNTIDNFDVVHMITPRILNFPTELMAKEFIVTFFELLTTAKPLL